MITSDKREIKRWVEERNGVPGIERGTGEDTYSVLGIKFSWNMHSPFREITWEEFFDKLEKYNLMFGFQEKAHYGKKSRYYKILKAR